MNSRDIMSESIALAAHIEAHILTADLEPAEIQKMRDVQRTYTDRAAAFICLNTSSDHEPR